MLVSEGQTQNWINTANRENPESSLELQTGDQFDSLLHGHVQTIARQLFRDMPRVFLKLVDLNKI